MSNIPPSRWMNRFSPFYRNLNSTERTFCRLKDFQRIALATIDWSETTLPLSVSSLRQRLVVSSDPNFDCVSF
jgi:transposase